MIVEQKNRSSRSALTVNVSVKDIEPMKSLVVSAFELCCLYNKGKDISHKIFDLEIALSKMGVNEETYINPCLMAGDGHEQG